MKNKNDIGGQFNNLIKMKVGKSGEIFCCMHGINLIIVLGLKQT